MVATVLDTKSDLELLTPTEIRVLSVFQSLSVHAQNLFVFLVIHPTWHRLPSLKLVEIPWGDLSCTIAELVRRIEPAEVKSETPETKVKPELADVCMKAEEEMSLDPVYIKKEEALESESPSKMEPFAATFPAPSDADIKFDDPGPSTFFPSRGLEAIPLSLCSTDSEMSLRELLEYMGPDEQRIIGKDLKIKAKKKTDLIESILTFSSSQTTLADFFGKGKAKAGTEKPSSHEVRLRAMIMKKLQKLVRVNQDVYDILRLVHILYFRSTQWPAEILPRPLRHLQRNYPNYIRTRSTRIWPNRAMLIEYEDTLKAEAAIEGAFPSPDGEPTSPKTSKIKAKDRPVEDDGEAQAKEKREKKAAAVRKAKADRKLFDELYARWTAHLGIKTGTAVTALPGFERFEPGYVLTRALHKGAKVLKVLKALKVLKNRSAEADVYAGFLDQKYWCMGLRGPWHIRWTAINADRIKDAPDEGKSALEASKSGISDLATGSVYRPPLIKYLLQLQKRLQVPPEDQVDLSEGPKVPKVVLEAERIIDEEKKKTSQWKGPDDEVVPIEELVSQHYKKDFANVSTGTCFFTTLFTLLFWDIIFMPVEGAFDTHFQAGPLDLCDDTFIASRHDAITRRLAEIEDDKALCYLKRHDTEHRPGKSCAVGVRWDLCVRRDLVGIVQCIPGQTLAMICRMFCEDYAGACAGAPHLIVWDLGNRDYKLVHIKGTGYSSRQSQKAWRDVLARLQSAEQQACEVVEFGKKKTKGKKKAADSDADSGSEEDELESEKEEDCGRRSQSQGRASKKRPHDSDEEDEYQPKRRKTSSISFLLSNRSVF
ncbi:hypothetical protein B0H17DRAFT_1034785 [Mycena rosella]|uniref:Fanconi-associated nuclease n=1 Tax=Mycena rosella TaxID=1033263 RepID=A0AAD7GWT0_MYCRO|nr:hypothetical protein B0H17DRAFT_1034785 [Mycena rosella]